MIINQSLNQGFSPVTEFNKLLGFYTRLNIFDKMQEPGNRTVFMEKKTMKNSEKKDKGIL